MTQSSWLDASYKAPINSTHHWPHQELTTLPVAITLQAHNETDHLRHSLEVV